MDERDDNEAAAYHNESAVETFLKASSWSSGTHSFSAATSFARRWQHLMIKLYRAVLCRALSQPRPRAAGVGARSRCRPLPGRSWMWCQTNCCSTRSSSHNSSLSVRSSPSAVSTQQPDKKRNFCQLKGCPHNWGRILGLIYCPGNSQITLRGRGGRASPPRRAQYHLATIQN